MAGVEYDNVWKHFEAQAESAAAVRGLSLDIADRELLVLLGPSGCGKSTTLRMVAGFVEPTAGRIVLDGTDITHAPANRRDIGMEFQSNALFPHTTAQRNGEFGPPAPHTADAAQPPRAGPPLRLYGRGAPAGVPPTPLPRPPSMVAGVCDSPRPPRSSAVSTR